MFKQLQLKKYALTHPVHVTGCCYGRVVDRD